MANDNSREVDPAALPDGGPSDGHDEELMDHHRDVVSPGISVSDGTSVTRADDIPDVDVERSEPDPDRLVDGNRVGDGTELE